MSRARSSAAHVPSISIVISTYEWPEALQAMLRALAEQSDQQFDVVVADDGSGPATAAVVESWRGAFGARLVHVWQPDEGFRVALARNRAALAAHSDYLVFVDGDAIPRSRFVAAIRACARPGWFVAGRRLELAPELTQRVLEADAPVHRRSLVGWLRDRGSAGPLSALLPRDRRLVGARGLPQFEPRDRAYGFLLGVAREDFERANGYDSRFVGWGEEDVDLVLRLSRLGLRCGHAGPHATLLHLWHERRDRQERPNWMLLEDTKNGSRTTAVDGLRELVATAAVDPASTAAATIAR